MIQALPGGAGTRSVAVPVRGAAARRGPADHTAAGRRRALRAADDPDDTRATGPRIRLDLLGGFALHLDGEQAQPGVGARRLLALLAVEPGGLTRARAAAVLWPGLDPARAGAALRTALHRLPGRRTDLLHDCGERLRLAPEVTVDLGERRAVAARVLNLALPLDAEELALAAGCDFGLDLLPDWEEDWLDHHRLRWREQRVHTLEALSCRLVQAGWVGAAVDAALVAVHADSLRESAHETLVAAYLAAGNRIAAHAYRRAYRELLRRELGGAPDGPDADVRASADGPPAGIRPPVRGLHSLHRPGPSRRDEPT
jgi:DNA-binding SARP family transcriptional activator